MSSRIFGRVALSIFIVALAACIVMGNYAAAIGGALIVASAYIKFGLADRLPLHWPEWLGLLIASIPMWIFMLALPYLTK
ncbi:hypothetical protein JDN40_10600 [Rhodomicrobium vannielii ATCC 17100]|uniref:hypothetical protein n=1 Tax=Rhodomicrobium vannielii TaxID=1069 RepID=UPI0019198981|nr:hypothetical protein [Rhodomicrobium vannielii]MBJ7534553.1 hypothetical protein [Rhodomicrobium vannielii ATCC 17100]